MKCTWFGFYKTEIQASKSHPLTTKSHKTNMKGMKKNWYFQGNNR